MGNPRWKWKLSLACSTFGSSYILYIYIYIHIGIAISGATLLGATLSTHQWLKWSSNGFVKSESQDSNFCRCSQVTPAWVCAPFSTKVVKEVFDNYAIFRLSSLCSSKKVETRMKQLEVTFAAFAFHFWNLDFTVSMFPATRSGSCLALKWKVHMGRSCNLQWTSCVKKANNLMLSLTRSLLWKKSFQWTQMFIISS